MLRYILMAIGTVLSVLFIVQMKRGEQYEPLVAGLDENEYPLHELYVVGFAWNTTPVLKIRQSTLGALSAQAALLYEPKYVEYYVNVVWAQTITLVHLFAAFTFLVAGLLYSMAPLMLLAGILICLVAGAYCMQNMETKVTERMQECDAQLPEVVSTMAILVNSGMILRDAWIMVAESKDGAIYTLMKQAAENMKNGSSDSDAIFLFGRISNSAEIKKFTSLLLQSIEKGGSELTSFLANQSSEMWQTKRQHMIQEGEKANTKLLIPILLIFAGVIVVVLTAAFAGLLF